MSQSILTVTLNPALDLTGHLPELKIGSVNLMQSGSLHPAGKGINVARVLRELGSQVAVTGLLGADNEGEFRQMFAQNQMDDHFMAVPGATRINVKLVEADGTVTDLNFPGVQVGEAELAMFEQHLLELAEKHEYIVLAGSLPRGITPDRCQMLVEELGRRGKKVIFDSSGQALAKGLQAKPYLVKPNEHELEEWAGRPLKTVEDLKQVAKELRAQGITHVVISRGADGVLWLADDQWWSARPPRMEVVSTVGAGDSMVAGLTWGLSQNLPTDRILRVASAVSALAVTQVGVGVADKQVLADLMAKIEVTRLN